MIVESGVHRRTGNFSLNHPRVYNKKDTLAEMLAESQNDSLNNILKDPFKLEKCFCLETPSLIIGGNYEK